MAISIASVTHEQFNSIPISALPCGSNRRATAAALVFSAAAVVVDLHSVASGTFTNCAAETAQTHRTTDALRCLAWPRLTKPALPLQAIALTSTDRDSSMIAAERERTPGNSCRSSLGASQCSPTTRWYEVRNLSHGASPGQSSSGRPHICVSPSPHSGRGSWASARSWESLLPDRRKAGLPPQAGLGERRWADRARSLFVSAGRA